jgi:predicted N-formylglutamate amidohydrolase
MLTCEHASGTLPRGFPADSASRKLLRTHWGWDLGAWELTRGLAASLGAGAVGGRWSRLVIDLNRPLGDPELFRDEIEGVALPWNRHLSAAERRRRIRDAYDPYHDEIDRRLDRHLRHGVRPLLLAIHTFAPVVGRSRRGFDAGILYIDSRREAWLLGRGLREEGLSVRYNEPYSGPAGLMDSAERHGSRHGIPHLELEINQGRLGSRESAGVLTRAVARALPPLLPVV